VDFPTHRLADLAALLPLRPAGMALAESELLADSADLPSADRGLRSVTIAELPLSTTQDVALSTKSVDIKVEIECEVIVDQEMTT